jgi:uncharacterized membrane protein
MHQEPVSLSGRLIHRLNHLKSMYRLLMSVGVSVLATLVLLGVHMEPLTRIMVGWDIYCLAVLVLLGISFFTMQSQNIRILARKQDNSRPVVFLIVLIACLTSIVAVMDLLSNKNGWVLPRRLEAFIYLGGVALSWILLHTTFTLRYAHGYYGDHPNNPDQFAGGLVIPGDVAPTYLDFAYFSFVIGMTFQVSDIAITSPRIRKWVLLHGLLSFVFNTVIVALTINEVVNLQP